MPQGFLSTPGACRVLVGLVLHDTDDRAVLQSLTAFCSVLARPLGAVLAGGLAIVVIVSQVEEPVEPDRDKRPVGLKRDAVLTHEVILIRNGAIGTGAGEIGHADNGAELTEEEGTGNGLHNKRD